MSDEPNRFVRKARDIENRARRLNQELSERGDE